MFEARVLSLLREYLGAYVSNIPDEALKISVWNGDVVLKDLKLKAEALNALKLPITVKAGFLGSVRLKVPWSSLGKDPVIVLLDRIFILAEPAAVESLSQGNEDEDQQKIAKRKKIEKRELEMLEAKANKSTHPSTETSSWIGSLIATVIGNLKISITNIHIRYEDSTSNPKHNFCIGVTLSKLAAFTVDDNGKETFATSSALDRVRKAVQLEKLSIYHDSNTPCWEINKKWEDLTSQEWSAIFEPSIGGENSNKELNKDFNFNHDHTYLLNPIGGKLRYLKLGKSENRNSNEPYQKAELVFDEVYLSLSEDQYVDMMKLLDAMNAYRTKAEFFHLRPKVSVQQNAKQWWIFGCNAVLQKINKRKLFKWKEIKYYCELQKKYIELYTSALVNSTSQIIDNPEVKTMDDLVDNEDMILIWRMMAHMKADKLKPKIETSESNKPAAKTSWISWVRGLSSESKPENKKEEQISIGLSSEEWDKLDEILQYGPGMDSPLFPQEEPSHMLQIYLDVRMKKNTLLIVDNQKADVLRCSFHDLFTKVSIYPKMIEYGFEIAYYGLSSPEGMLVKSVSKEGKKEALSAKYVQDPLESKFDWSLEASMAPCLVTIWRASFDRLIRFVKKGQAESPTLALDTAAAIWNKVKDARKRANEQLKLVLQQRKRFFIHLDLDAPKIAIPAEEISESRGTQLLVDLGHFTLSTDQDEPQDESMEAMYTRFKVKGSELSAFLVEGEYDWLNPPPLPSVKAAACGTSVEEGVYVSHQPCRLILPVIDQCKMSAILHQTLIDYPDYPATRVSFFLPRLGFHFSPKRFHQLMRVLDAVSTSSFQETESDLVSWKSPDLSGPLWQLYWKRSIAEWRPSWVALVGPYLYFLDSESATSKQKSISLIGKSVMEIKPDEIANTENVIAIYDRGMDLSQVLSPDNAVILRFPEKEAKLNWTKQITNAIYRFSSPLDISLLNEEEGNEVSERGEQDVDEMTEKSTQKQMYVIGALGQLELSVSGIISAKANSDEEVELIGLRATGGQVELLQSLNKTAIGIGVYQIEIEDMLRRPISPSSQYMARSLLASDSFSEISSATQPVEPSKSDSKPSNQGDEEEFFADAEEDFYQPGTDDVNFFDASNVFESKESSSDYNVPSFRNAGVLLPGYKSKNLSSGEYFVTLQLLMIKPGTSAYKGTDSQMIIAMSTLEFFCNRPTVAALMSLGEQLSRSSNQESNDQVSKSDPSSQLKSVEPVGMQGMEVEVVKGLHDQGKNHIVFQLIINMGQARIVLNLEDDSILAILEQQQINLDIKIYPSSMKVSSKLGNLKICDMRLGADHKWGWCCDLRNPESKSLVQLEFCSYNPDGDDFKGYEYSLSGQLNAVRVVYLNRFIQELTTYIIQLPTPIAQSSVKVFDSSEGVDRLIEQSEINGSPGILFDIALDAPVLIIPKSSNSSEFMQLELGHLKVFNKIQWRGGSKENSDAIKLDFMTVESRNINLYVGIDNKIGEAMVQAMEGLTFTLKRPLRDIFKKTPPLELHIKMLNLRCAMSDHEYSIITQCASLNVSEKPTLPSNFHLATTSKQDSNKETMVNDQLETNSIQTQTLESIATAPKTSVRVTLDVSQASFELYCGRARDFSLSMLQVQGFWFSYRLNNRSESEIIFSLSKISILDKRPDTLPELSLMMGSTMDAEAVVSSDSNVTSLSSLLQSPASLTMLVFNASMKQSAYKLSLRIQRPRLLVALDFLLAIGEFFVPSLGAMAGKETDRDVQDDPICTQKDLILSTPLYTQEKDSIVRLHEQHRLVVDHGSIDEFEYDGSGGTLQLSTKGDGIEYRGPHLRLILIGDRKKLRFKNIHIQADQNIDEYVSLGFESSFSASIHDNVTFELCQSILQPNDDISSVKNEHQSDGNEKPPLDFSLELDFQAVSPELTFYDSTKWPTEFTAKPEKLLRVNFDIYLMISTFNKEMSLDSSLKRLMVETGSGLSVLEPLDATISYSFAQDTTRLDVSCTDIALRIPLNVIRLCQRLQLDVSKALMLGRGPIFSPCTQFDLIWSNSSDKRSDQKISIWRPISPTGYAIAGYCITTGFSPPSNSVLAINMGYSRVKTPLSYEHVWSSSENKKLNLVSFDENTECHIWRPVAPNGYLSLGCVATCGNKTPILSSVFCVREDLVSSSSFPNCVFYEEWPSGNGSSIWKANNSMDTFFAWNNLSSPPRNLARELRNELLDQTTTPIKPEIDHNGKKQLEATVSKKFSSHDIRFSENGKEKHYLTVTDFSRIWWDKGGSSQTHVTIWRPVPPPGFCVLGDVAVAGYDRPNTGLVVSQDEDIGKFSKPINFKLQATLSGKGWEEASIWMPVPPAGYVSLGCVASLGKAQPSIELVRCVRLDLVKQKSFMNSPVWSWIPYSKNEYAFSIWPVQNQANTFTIFKGLRKPPWRMAYSLTELETKQEPDNLDVVLKTPQISCTFFNDLEEMMTPLIDLSLVDVNLFVNGRLGRFNSVLSPTVAASYYNPQLSVWEPLIEPFHGIFKYESQTESDIGEFIEGSVIQITPTSILNLNLTSSSIDLLISAMSVWTKNVQSEEAAMALMQSMITVRSKSNELTAVIDRSQALKVILENKLGKILFAQTAHDDFHHVFQIDVDSPTTLPLPPMKFPVFFTRHDLKMRKFVAVRVIEAKNVSIPFDASGEEFICNLRITDNMEEGPGREKKLLLPNSRTRSSFITVSENEKSFSVVWNEVFLFEFSVEKNSSIEFEVTNISANGGLGTSIGKAEMSVQQEDDSSGNSNWGKAKNALALGHSLWQFNRKKHIPLYPLDSKSDPSCVLSVSQFVFTIGRSGNIQTPQSVLREEPSNFVEADAVIRLSHSAKGPWTGFRTIFTHSITPIAFGNRIFCAEMEMTKGMKSIRLSGLASVHNYTDVDIQVSVFSTSLPSSHGNASFREQEVEMYENQRFQPIRGWGSLWPGHFLPGDPSRFSALDLSKSTQDLPKQPPSGWIWTSDWTIDRTGFVDSEGWFYGPDFKRLKSRSTSPKSASKGVFDFTRRRRIVRRLRKVNENETDSSSRKILGVVKPNESLPLPLESLNPSSDWRFQVRPYFEDDDSRYQWSKITPFIPSKSSLKSFMDEYGLGYYSNNKVNIGESDSKFDSNANETDFVLKNLFISNEVETKEKLLECVGTKKDDHSWWLCLEANAEKIQGDTISSVMKWKISIRSPLKIENHLPCLCEFLIWEKVQLQGADTRSVSKSHEIVRPGQSLHIYAADIRSPLSLTCLPQGGWKHEQESVLISDPYALNLPGHFFMRNAESKRRVQVSIENDMGSREVSAKIIRVFVPYWLRNDVGVPLFFGLAYIEPIQGGGKFDSNWLMLARKSAKHFSKVPKRTSSLNIEPTANKFVRMIEVMEDGDDLFQPKMFSLPSSNSSSSSLSPSSVGLSVCLSPNIFKSAISINMLEEKNERAELTACDSSGRYLKLSVSLDLSSGFERTKVLSLQPHSVLSNLTGFCLFFKQFKSNVEDMILPSERNHLLVWESVWNSELLQIRLNETNWSSPFPVDTEGRLHVKLPTNKLDLPNVLQVDIQRSGSQLVVTFSQVTKYPFLIENRSMILPIRYHQCETGDLNWEQLQTFSTKPYVWDDPVGEKFLEIMVDGANTLSARKVNIEEEGTYEPTLSLSNHPVAALVISVFRRKEYMHILIQDWRPYNTLSNSSDLDSTITNLKTSTTELSSRSSPSPSLSSSRSFSSSEQSESPRKFSLLLQLDELGLSIVDHTPEEILYISMQSAFIQYDSNEDESTKIELKIGHLQVDNQSSLTALPVVLAPQEGKFKNELDISNKKQDYVLKMIVSSKPSPNEECYPYIGFQLPSKAWLVNIHEPLIWKLYCMIQKLDFSGNSANQKITVAIDPYVNIWLLDISESLFKLTLVMAPSFRERSISGFLSSLISSLGNTDEMPLKLKQRVGENIRIRKSQIVSAAVRSISNDLLSQPLRLLAGMDVLGNASSTLGHISKGVAALSMDKKFINNRQTQEMKSVEGLGDALREGGGALAKGLFRGVTGILTKPVEGALQSGVEGFVTGVGKGIIGVAAQPMSGALDLVSKTAEGVNVTYSKLTAAVLAKQSLERRRLPRSISGDHVLKPFQMRSACGQMILQLAERGTLFGGSSPFDIKEKAIYAITDAYENHFDLPNKLLVMITNLRVMLLQHPSKLSGQKVDLLKDPCSILWDVTWQDFVEVKIDVNQDAQAIPIFVVSLFSSPAASQRGGLIFDARQSRSSRSLVCSTSAQSFEVCSAIKDAYEKYNPNQAVALSRKKKMVLESRPYGACLPSR